MRDVADLAQRDRLAQQIIELLEVVSLAPRILIAGELEIPVAERADRPLLGDEDMRGRELGDVAVDRARRRHIEQRQVLIDGLGAPLARHVRIFEERLQLRAEDHARARQLRVVERLDAEAIAGEDQPARQRVPDGEGEHAAEISRRTARPTPRSRGR